MAKKQEIVRTGIHKDLFTDWQQIKVEVGSRGIKLNNKGASTILSKRLRELKKGGPIHFL